MTFDSQCGDCSSDAQITFLSFNILECIPPFRQIFGNVSKVFLMLSAPKQGYSMVNHPALPAVFVECEHEALVVYTGDAGLVAVFGREQLGADVSR